MRGRPHARGVTAARASSPVVASRWCPSTAPARSRARSSAGRPEVADPRDGGGRRRTQARRRRMFPPTDVADRGRRRALTDALLAGVRAPAPTGGAAVPRPRGPGSPMPAPAAPSPAPRDPRPTPRRRRWSPAGHREALRPRHVPGSAARTAGGPRRPPSAPRARSVNRPADSVASTCTPASSAGSGSAVSPTSTRPTGSPHAPLSHRRTRSRVPWCHRTATQTEGTTGLAGGARDSEKYTRRVSAAPSDATFRVGCPVGRSPLARPG